mmetsp:Transcript_7989/g.21943  ORF Transcript_7989/g.21943 Transcript_7989/m.21943 type:complete len:240 (+) Transcript_7989:253-972(+)
MVTAATSVRGLYSVLVSDTLIALRICCVRVLSSKSRPRGPIQYLSGSDTFTYPSSSMNASSSLVMVRRTVCMPMTGSRRVRSYLAPTRGKRGSRAGCGGVAATGAGPGSATATVASTSTAAASVTSSASLGASAGAVAGVPHCSTMPTSLCARCCASSSMRMRPSVSCLSPSASASPGTVAWLPSAAASSTAAGVASAPDSYDSRYDSRGGWPMAPSGDGAAPASAGATRRGGGWRRWR